MAQAVGVRVPPPASAGAVTPPRPLPRASDHPHTRAQETAIPTILLIRHAQASFGAADYDVLSDLGHAQTRALVDGLRRRQVSAAQVVCGDLRRQRDTAGPCAEAWGLDAVVDARWNEYEDRDILTHHARTAIGLERHEGDQPLSSREFQEILNRALEEWIDAGSSSPCRETWPAFQERVMAGLADVSRGLRSGQSAIVVSSGGAIGALSASLMGLPPRALVAFNHVSVNTGLSKLAVGRSGTTLVSSNEHAHLDEAEGSLVSYR